MSDDVEARCDEIVLRDYRELFELWAIDALTMVQDGLAKCQSPIEKLMGASLAYGLAHELGCAFSGFCYPAYWRHDADSFLQVEMQKELGAYRADFAITYRHKMADDFMARSQIVVECDGHAFHEKTPEQAERDKSRDRFLASAGWTVLRFTGREIVRDPRACVASVAKVIQAQECAQLQHHWELVGV